MRSLASSSQSECFGYHQQWCVGSKTLLQQNSPFLNWSRQIAQADLDTTTTTTTVLWLFVRDYPGEPVPEETFTHQPS